MLWNQADGREPAAAINLIYETSTSHGVLGLQMRASYRVLTGTSERINGRNQQATFDWGITLLRLVEAC